MSSHTPESQYGRRASWEFPGWGTAERIDNLDTEPLADAEPTHHLEGKLGEWKSTAICGNDITSSCLYVVALSALYAGRFAPVALALVAAVLYLFRKIYAEVGTALPLNGGAYNALLNTTTKAKASVAACLTLLSYIATAVISASEAMHYAHNLSPGLDVFRATVILLAIFAVLNLLGIRESSIVALVLFTVHMATLVVLVLASTVHASKDFSILLSNWQVPAPGGALKAIFFGFAAGMLGISGFESSANFIEEQKPGVFAKTLRNMWIAVAVFNPLLSLLAMALLPLDQVAENKEDLLARMGLISTGPAMQTWVSIDAALVLSGAVLTSYVGVAGLVRRMTLDRCLPQFLLRENRRGTNHWIILLFFVVCWSILKITAGRIELLAGVYTLSFLGVMTLFAVGNMLLKIERARLPRDVRAPWLAVIIAFISVSAALAGNTLLNPLYVRVFAIYFTVALIIVGVMFIRVQILKLVLAASRAIIERFRQINRQVSRWIIGQIDRINRQSVVFFTRGDSLETLNKAALYVLRNEQTRRLHVIHCFEREEEIPPGLADQLRTIDRIYPDLRVDLILVKGNFGPLLISRLSRRLGVPKNYMFIGTPGDRFPHNIAELGGVRLII